MSKMFAHPKAFTYEYEMLALVSDYLPAMLEPKYEHYITVPELQIGGRIPDFLLASFECYPSDGRHRKLTSTQAHVLQAIWRFGEAVIPQVADEIILNENRLLSCLDALEKKGFISRTEREGYRVSEAIREQRVEIVAVEMKLRDWRVALAQAQGYTGFANRSYVILDGFQVASNAAMAEAYADAGIGLFLQHGWQLEPIVMASEQNPSSSHRFIAIQKLFQKHNQEITPSHRIATY
jgi:hypothetical protein